MSVYPGELMSMGSSPMSDNGLWMSHSHTSADDCACSYTPTLLLRINSHTRALVFHFRIAPAQSCSKDLLSLKKLSSWFVINSDI